MTGQTARNEPGLAGTEARASAASSEHLTPAQPEVAAAPAAAQPEAAPQAAVIQVLSGRPSAEELAALVAALVAVLSAVGGGEASESETGRSVWSDPAWRLSGPQPRRGGWRTSALPR